MAQYVARLRVSFRMHRFTSWLFVAQMVTVGLIAIGLSGVACGLIGYRYGDRALALDSESAHLSAERCADLLEYHPEKTTCIAAELAHHADEIVEVRLMAGAAGLLALAVCVVMRSGSDLVDDELQRQHLRFLWLATGAFGLAAAVLLIVGTSEQMGTGEAGAHVFIDGGVSFVFFLFAASSLVRARRRQAH